MLQEEIIPEERREEDPDQPLGTDPYLEAPAFEEPAFPEPVKPPLIPPPMAPLTPAAPQPPVEQHEEQTQTEAPSVQIPTTTTVTNTERHIHLNVESPTYKQTNIYQQTCGFGPEQSGMPSVRTPVRQQYRARSTTPRRLRSSTLHPPLPADIVPTAAHSTEQHVIVDLTGNEPHDRPSRNFAQTHQWAHPEPPGQFLPSGHLHR